MIIKDHEVIFLTEIPLRIAGGTDRIDILCPDMFQ